MKKDSKATDVTKLLQVQLIDEIIVRMQDKKLSEESIKKAKPFIVEFAKRNNIWSIGHFLGCLEVCILQ